MGTLSPGLYAGYMAVVPPEWRTLLGGPAITGQGVLSIIGRTSFGPAAFAFDPDGLGRENPVPATPLVYYTMEHLEYVARLHAHQRRGVLISLHDYQSVALSEYAMSYSARLRELDASYCSVRRTVTSRPVVSQA